MDSLLAQIGNCDKFFHSQRGLVSDETLQASMTSMSQSLKDQIGRLPEVDVASAARLNDAVQHASSFSAALKAEMATAITERCTQATNSGLASKRTLQTMKDARGYFTPTDWQSFEDENITLCQKVNVCADRLMLVGMRNPSEQTLKTVVAVLAVSHFPHAAAKELYGLVIDLKMAMHSRRGHDFPQRLLLTKFPLMPDGLSHELFARAYSQERPTYKDTNGYTAMVAKIPLRNTNKHLVNMPGNIPAGTMSPAVGAPANPVAMLLQQLMAPHMHQGTGDGQNLLRNLVIHPPRRGPASQSGPAPAPLAAITDGPPTSAEGATPPMSSTVASVAAHAADVDGMGQAHGKDDKVVDGKDDKLEGGTVSAVDLNKLVAMASGGAPENGTGKAQGNSKGNAKDNATCKAACASTAKPKGKAKGKAKSQPKGKAKGKAKGKVTTSKKGKLMLGCAKCRGHPHGCGQCRNPDFGGKRFRGPDFGGKPRRG